MKRGLKSGEFNRLYPNHFDFGASNRKPLGESSFHRLFRRYRESAKRRKLEFSITTEDLRELSKMNCNYCGIEPRQIMHEKDANGPYIHNGLDRIDPLKGYTKENITTCCKNCNRAKSDMTKEEWVSYIDRLVNFNKQKTVAPCL